MNNIEHLEWRVATEADNHCIGKDGYNGVIAGGGYTGNGFLITGYVPEDAAKKMAATPDLLDACRQFVNAVDTNDQKELDCAYESAARAIKKAGIEQPPQIERAYCLGCRREIPTESGQLCQKCGSVAAIEVPGPEGAR